ncbi:hypothetical protein GCM10022221_22280 [Actinocorallia aurea]
MRSDEVPRHYVVSGRWPKAELAYDCPVGARYGLELARRLLAEMTLQGLSQRDVAARSGIAQATIGRITRGEVYPDLATLARLETSLHARLYPADLLDRPGGPAGPS